MGPHLVHKGTKMFVKNAVFVLLLVVFFKILMTRLNLLQTRREVAAEGAPVQRAVDLGFVHSSCTRKGCQRE